MSEHENDESEPDKDIETEDVSEVVDELEMVEDTVELLENVGDDVFDFVDERENENVVLIDVLCVEMENEKDGDADKLLVTLPLDKVSDNVGEEVIEKDREKEKELVVEADFETVSVPVRVALKVRERTSEEV